MKKFILFLLMIAMLIIPTACGSEKDTYERNPDFLYGELNEHPIDYYYDLVGEKTQKSMSILGGTEKVFVTTSETSDGGVVSYGNRMYVYSSDKNNKDDVEEALISEALQAE